MKENKDKKNNAVEKVENLSKGEKRAENLSDGEKNTENAGKPYTETNFFGEGLDGTFNDLNGMNIMSGINGLTGTGMGDIEPNALPDARGEDSYREEREREAIEKANKKREKEKAKIAAKQARFRQKEERARRKADERERRAKFKEERRKNRSQRGLGGWIATVVTLSCVTLILGSLLAFTLFTDYIQAGEPQSTSPAAQRAYYDFVGYVDNMDTNMSKFFVSSDTEGRQKILGELAVQSNLADASLSELPMQDEAKYLTSKYINQVGDYAKYLNNRLIEGDTLTEDDYSRLYDLYRINSDLKDSLNGLNADMADGYDFSTLVSGIDGDLITERFTDMETKARDYPEMIYDGPFSDGLDGIKPKGLNYAEITENEAIERFKALFAFYDTENVEVTGKIENSKIETFNVRGDIKEGGEAYAQFSVRGGKLILFNAYRDCKNEVYGEAQCLKVASEFLEKAGFKNMKSVWQYSAGNIEHFNFVYEKDGILVYPDMVKVNVCRETGRVSGVDADAYFMNHTEEREFGSSLHSLEEAAAKVNKNLEITSASAAVIPVGNGNEKAAYEFIATYDGSTYYVYIDAKTLKQADLFKVVETAEGRLLI
ncbi:MAG: germination protein YpeB [Clostridia bacterium]|nr:germination protein YpeB [Clostridia bacterium]